MKIKEFAERFIAAVEMGAQALADLVDMALLPSIIVEREDENPSENPDKDFADILGSTLVMLTEQQMVNNIVEYNSVNKPVMKAIYRSQQPSGKVFQVWEGVIDGDGGYKWYRIIGSSGDTTYRDNYLNAAKVKEL